MKTFGEALHSEAGAMLRPAAQRQQWESLAAASKSQFDRPRLFRVQLVANIFSEIELTGTISTVERQAEKICDEATVYMTTRPTSFRVLAQRRRDPRRPDGPLEWAEVYWGPLEAHNPSSPCAWQWKNPAR